MNNPPVLLIDDEISKAAFSLLLKEPFYAHVLAGMPREVTERVRTAAVAWNGQHVSLNRRASMKGASVHDHDSNT